jgi:hypothetical protein
MKRKPTKTERKTPPKVLREVCLRAGGIWNPESQICTGGTCEICHGKKMDARGLKFMHKKRRKMGGTTSPKIHSAKNILRSCYPCDEINDGVILPKSKPVDKPTLPCLHPQGLRAYSVETQTGIHKKDKGKPVASSSVKIEKAGYIGEE